MMNAITLDLCMKSAILWIIIPVVSLYQHHIYISEKLPITKCQQINNTTYQCSSITELFQQLSNCCNSTDITIEPGNYNLALSYELADLHDIRIRSETKAVIQCAANVNGTYDFDTGIAFVRVSNLVITNITIIGCGMKHITTNPIRVGKFRFVRSALYIQNSTNISLHHLTISKSNGIGLMVYDTNGTVSIKKSSFINSSLNSLEQSQSLTGGCGLYIEFTVCSPGFLFTECDSKSNHFNKFAKYTIDQCVIEGNTANYHFNGSVPEALAEIAFVTFGTGGGLSLWLFGHAQNNSFRIISTSFVANRAYFFGGLNVNIRHHTTYNNVEILQCSFMKNLGEHSGGALALGNVIHQTGGESLFNTMKVANCIFEQNKALIGVGGGIVGFGSREPQRTQPTNHFEIHNSSFINNGAKYGSAIQMNKEHFDSILVGTIFTLVLNNCTFSNNNLFDSNSSSVGAVATSGINIEFRGTTVFINNNSTALVVDGAFVRFSNDCLTIFEDNRGLHGGAILLRGGSWITVYPNSSVMFLRNTAVQHGGAIYVALSTPFDYLVSHICFVRYFQENVSPREWKTNFTFINNTAGESDNTLFVSTLQPCLKVYTTGISLLYKNPFYHYSPMNDSIVSTLPATFKFLHHKNRILSIVPGEIFDLPVELTDELNQSVSSAMFIATCTGPPSPYVMPTYHFTNGSIQIAGKPNEICELQLETDADYQVSVTMHLNLLNCPPGFVYSDDNEQCECLVNHTHQNPAIIGCEFSSFQAYFDQFYWVGYETDSAVDLLISPCPYRYCYEDNIFQGQLLPRDANKTTLDKFVCGNRSRTGLLCGECIEGYSVALNSPTFTCYRCKTPSLGILYLFLSYIIPVTILFYIIMTYNIRMTTGPIGAFLFFSQIISSQYRFAFDYSVKANSDETFEASNIVITIYSISNLQFFQHNVFSYCLFPNAGTVDILAFNLLLSFYPVLLVFTYFLLRRYCTCKPKCYQKFRFSTKSVTHGICAFLVLCFAKINVLAFGILKSADISYANETNFRKVVYLQGSLKYFGDALFDIYATGSLLTIITVIFIPTLILVFHPIMILVVRYFEWGETKCVLFINKLLFIHRLKPVLDSFQGDYKDNYSFFAGLHSFLYRIIFFCIVVAASTTDVNDLLLLMTAYFVVMLLIHMLAMPFKRYIDNASYSLIYVLMLTILIIEQYLFSTDKSSAELIWLEIFLSLLPFICVVVYCSWKVLVATEVIWKKYHKKGNKSHLVRE